MGEVGGEEGSGGRRTRRGWFRSSSSPWAPLLSPWSPRRLARFWRGLRRGEGSSGGCFFVTVLDEILAHFFDGLLSGSEEYVSMY